MLVGGCGTLAESQERMENCVKLYVVPCRECRRTPPFTTVPVQRARRHYDWYCTTPLRAITIQPGRRYEVSSVTTTRLGRHTMKRLAVHVRSDSFADGGPDRSHQERRRPAISQEPDRRDRSARNRPSNRQRPLATRSQPSQAWRVARWWATNSQRRVRDDEVFPRNGLASIMARCTPSWWTGSSILRTGDRVRFEGDRLYRIS